VTDPSPQAAQEKIMFTDVYQKWTTTPVVREEDQPPVPEKVIRCVWNDQLFNTPQLQTTEGHAMEVVFPGYWNFGGGPDFQNAAVRIDGKLLEGDVELHVFGCDWKSHGHSDNNEYDNVILHVFLWADRSRPAQPNNQSRPHIHELELKTFLKHGLLKLNEQFDFDSYPILNPFNHGLCHRPLSQLTEEQLAQLLDAAGNARIHTKMDRFHDRIILDGYEQTFYEGVAEALGYPGNKTSFRALAQRLPLEILRALLSRGDTIEQHALGIQALMFGVSGLIDFSILDLSKFPTADQTYFAQIKQIWDRHAHRLEDRLMNPRDWKFGKMRPANFPYRRVAALSHLLVGHSKQGLFEDFLKLLQAATSKKDANGLTPASRKRLLNFFCVEAEDYWSRHYIPGGKMLHQAQQLVGEERSREIAINIALPIGMIYAHACKSGSLEVVLQSLLQTPHRSADNKLLRFMKHYILGNQEPMLRQLKTDRQTQGLMQIYQDYCTRNENNCLRCPFPDRVDGISSLPPIKP